MTSTSGPMLRLREQLWHHDQVVPEPHPDAREHALLLRGGTLTVLPVHPRSAAAAALTRWTDAESVRSAAMRLAGWAGLRSGAAQALLRQRVWIDAGPGSLHRYLAEAVQRPQVHLTAGFGPPRPNQKPVVRVFDDGGTTVAFAKIGWNDLTTRLVEHEAGFLRSVDRPAGARLALPELVQLGTWGDRTVAVLSVLLGEFSWRRAPAPDVAVLREVAALGETYRSQLATSEYRTRIGASAAQHPHLGTALAEMDRRWATLELPFGRWHGDWTPWNMRTNRRTTVVWDWERTAPDTPIGFDALHYEFQARMARGDADALAAFMDGVSAATPVLHDLGVPPAGIPAVASLYLAELLARFGPATRDSGSGVAWLDALLPDVLRHFGTH